MSVVRLGVTRNQRNLWAGEWSVTDRRTHTIAQYVEIHGPLELTALEHAVRQVVAEAEAMRARFREDGGELVQEILPSVRWRPAVLDLSGRADPVAAFDDWIAAELREPILADDFPLFSSALLRLGTDHYRWYLRFHHIAIDGFSAGLLLRRVADLYAALSTGGDAGPSPFHPIAALHEEQLAYEQSDRFAADRAFWRERLNRLPDPVRVAPYGAPGTHVFTGAGLAPPPAAQIRRIADEAGTAWPDVVMALTAAHVAAECGVRETALTVAVSNRTSAVARGVPTNTANEIVLSVGVPLEASFQELVTEVAAHSRDAVRHQNFPYAMAMDDLGERAAGHRACGPSVNIMPFGGDFALPGCSTSVHRKQTGRVRDFEVAAYGDARAHGMRINVLMRVLPEDQALLSAAERRLADRFAAVVADPKRPLAQHPQFAPAWSHAR